MGAAQSSQPYDSPQGLAMKLARRQPCILAFMSPHCGLCASLLPELDQVSSSSGDSGEGLQVAVLNAQQDKVWAPEMLAYSVESVPCFVLLEPRGGAVCKTAAPRNQQQMSAALQQMVDHAALIMMR